MGGGCLSSAQGRRGFGFGCWLGWFGSFGSVNPDIPNVDDRVVRWET